MSDRKIVSTERAPKAVGPYSQAVIHQGVAYLCGQGPLDPTTGHVVAGGIEEQTERVLQNLGAVLEASGSSFGQVLKVTVFLKDMNDFQKMNRVYSRYFPTAPPARSTVEAARLPLDTLVEIDAIAAVG
ncbi:MAG: RidA family protein [Bryobacteraceae bacterium]